jgi:hypothetical protein
VPDACLFSRQLTRCHLVLFHNPKRGSSLTGDRSNRLSAFSMPSMTKYTSRHSQFRKSALSPTVSLLLFPGTPQRIQIETQFQVRVRISQNLSQSPQKVLNAFSSRLGCDLLWVLPSWKRLPNRFVMLGRLRWQNRFCAYDKEVYEKSGVCSTYSYFRILEITIMETRPNQEDLKNSSHDAVPWGFSTTVRKIGGYMYYVEQKALSVDRLCFKD